MTRASYSRGEKYITAEELNAWIEALESGTYFRATEAMLGYGVDNDGEDVQGYCCLAVKCVVDGVDLRREVDYLVLGNQFSGTEPVDENGSSWRMMAKYAPGLAALPGSLRDALAKINDQVPVEQENGFGYVAKTLRQNKRYIVSGVDRWHADEIGQKIYPLDLNDEVAAR